MNLTNLVLITMLTGAISAQPSYPTYVKQKKKPEAIQARPSVNQNDPSTYMPKGTIYQKNGENREVTGAGQSVNVGTQGARQTYSRTPGDGPRVISGGSKITTSKIQRTPLPGSNNYPGQQP